MRMMWCQTAASSLLYLPAVQKQYSLALLPGGDDNLWETVCCSTFSALFVTGCKCTLPWHQMYRYQFLKFNKNLDQTLISPPPWARWDFNQQLSRSSAFYYKRRAQNVWLNRAVRIKVKQGIFWTTYFQYAWSSWSVKSMFKETERRGENNSQEPWVIQNRAWTQNNMADSSKDSAFDSGVRTNKTAIKQRSILTSNFTLILSKTVKKWKELSCKKHDWSHINHKSPQYEA